MQAALQHRVPCVPCFEWIAALREGISPEHVGHALRLFIFKGALLDEKQLRNDQEVGSPKLFRFRR